MFRVLNYAREITLWREKMMIKEDRSVQNKIK